MTLYRAIAARHPNYSLAADPATIVAGPFLLASSAKVGIAF